MNSNKYNIFLKINSEFLIKSFLLLLIFSISISVFSQTDTIPDLKTDSLKITSELDSLSNNQQVNDSINDNSISSDSIKYISMSPDAIDEVIDYSSSDSILFSLTEEKMYLYGTGSLTSQDMELKSSYVEISTKENYLYSETVKDSAGIKDVKPILKQENEEYTVKSVKYNFRTKKAIVKEVKTVQEQGYLHSDIAKMQSNKELHIKSGKFTTCDLDHPHFYIQLTKAKKIPDKHVISGPLYFVIADIPLYFIGLPFGMLPKKQKNTSGILMPEYGEEKNRGFFLRNGGYYWAINDNINASLVGDIYSKGSWGLTMSSQFKKIYKYSGNIQVKFNKNQTQERVINEIKGTPAQKSFWVMGSFSQDSKANPNSNFSANLNFGASGFHKENATDINDRLNSTRSSSISYRWAKPGSIFNFSANINGTQNTRDSSINLSLPTFSLNVKRIFPFKNIGAGSSKWYHKIGVTLSVNAKNSINTKDSLLFTKQTLYQMKNGVQYKLPVSTSFQLLNYINVSPSLSFNGRIYSSFIEQEQRYYVDAEDNIISTTENDTVYRMSFPFDFQFSVPLSTSIYGMFKINKGRLEAVRHVLKPSVSFSYRPDFSNSFWGFYGEKYNEATEEYDKYSYYLGYVYGYPPAGRSGSINFSLDNNFEMKLKAKDDNKKDSIQDVKKIKLLDRLNITASYNLAADSLNLSLINLNGATKLFKNFNVNFRATFDPYVTDTLGRRIHKYEVKENRRLARFTQGNISITGSIKPIKNSGEADIVNLPYYYYAFPDIPYADFDIPWNLSASYLFNITKRFETETKEFTNNITQSLKLNGSLSLTKNWNLSGQTTFNIQEKKFTTLSVSVKRDLHCWEMSFNVIPFGSMQSYSFRINVKSSIFKGIEYNKRKSWRDNILY